MKKTTPCKKETEGAFHSFLTHRKFGTTSPQFSRKSDPNVFVENRRSRTGSNYGRSCCIHGSVGENGVKACKHHLKRIVGESKLTFEEMATVLCQIEACLNSRPLYTALDSNDDDGIAPLTPGHFLTGRPLEALPDQVSTAPISTLKRWQLCQALIQHFWKRWSTEYLNALQRFNK